MSKKACFIVFVISLVTILVSHILGINVVNKEVALVWGQMQNVYIALTAIICSIFVSKTKHYWLIMIGLATITAAVVQTLVLHQALITIGLLYKIIAFLVYAYFFILCKYMI